MQANVYHINYKEIGLDIIFTPSEEKVKSALESGLYKKVAEVDSIDLDEVFKITNSMDTYWGENAGVKAVTHNNRSTSVGDIIEVDGKAHLVSNIGFKELSYDTFTLLPQEIKVKKFCP